VQTPGGHNRVSRIVKLDGKDPVQGAAEAAAVALQVRLWAQSSTRWSEHPVGLEQQASHNAVFILD
jgi:hypothetical protein